MQLLKEINESVNVIVEDNLEKGKKLYIEGICLQAAVKNRNGRIYPESVMDNEVARYIKEKINTKTAYGECTHPDTPQINLKEVSHRFVSLRKEGTNWIGKALILDTPNGNIVRGLLDGGCNVGVSSRALGSLKVNQEGIKEVQNDFKLITAADIVSDPSGPDCWVQGIMEGAEWVYNASTNAWILAENYKKNYSKMTSKSIEESMITDFQRFLKSL